ncbi:unnamed protein product [Brassica oleracea var. botrytis]
MTLARLEKAGKEVEETVGLAVKTAEVEVESQFFPRWVMIWKKKTKKKMMKKKKEEKGKRKGQSLMKATSKSKLFAVRELEKGRSSI